MKKKLAIFALCVTIATTAMCEFSGVGDSIFWEMCIAATQIVQSVQSYIYSSQAVWTNATAGTYAWQYTNSWSNFALPFNASTSTVTFLQSNEFVTGSITINSDPAVLTQNIVYIYGTSSVANVALNIGTPGNTWTMGGPGAVTPTFQYKFMDTNVGCSCTWNPNMVINSNLIVYGTGLGPNVRNLYFPCNFSGSGHLMLQHNAFTQLHLSGSNTCGYIDFSSGNIGKFYIDGPFCLSTGAVTFLSSCTFDCTTPGGVAISNGPAMYNLAAFTFAGTYPLNLGPNPVTLNANRVWTCNNQDLYVGGNINASSLYTLTHSGAGGLHLSGTNNALPVYAINGSGVNYFDSPTAAPSNVLTQSACSFDTLQSGVATNTYNPISTNMQYTTYWINSMGGTWEWGTGAVVTLGSVRSWTVSNGTLRIRGPVSGTFGENINTAAGQGRFEFWGPLTLPLITFSGGTCAINTATAPTGVVSASAAAYMDCNAPVPITNTVNTLWTITQNLSFSGTQYYSTGTNGTFYFPNGKTLSTYGSYPLAIDCPLFAPNGLTKNGPGGVIVGGQLMAYTNNTTLQAGTLYINGMNTNIFGVNQFISVSAGAMLAGTGINTYSNQIGAHGIFFGGGTNGCGSLMQSNQVHWSSQSTNLVNILSPTVYSQIVQASNVCALAGSAILQINDANATGIAAGFAFTNYATIGGGTITGNYSNVSTNGGTIAAQQYTWMLGSNTGGIYMVRQ